MPSYLHETLIELFRARPLLAAELLCDAFGVKLPGWERARVESGELPELRPTERRADLVVTFTDGDAPVLAVVVEVQLRPDARKRLRWPAYLATLYSRLECPTALLVLCADEATARWCAEPIEVGYPDLVVRPMVLGPDRVPLVTDRGQASSRPELAVLSAIAHGGRPEPERVFEALLAALDAVTEEHAILYHDLVVTALPPAARDQLEAWMATATGPYRQYTSDFINRYMNQGRAEGEILGEARGEARGEAKALLAVLGARGVSVSDAHRALILECTDIEQLDGWIRRAASAHSIEEVFG